MSNCSLEDAQKVVRWINSNLGFWEPSLELRESPVGGVGVFTTEPLDDATTESKVLLRLHKGSLLSSKTSCVANLLDDEEIDGVLGLILSFIYERDQGESSPWCDYISTIQYRDSQGELILPPSLWSKRQKRVLEGTELEIMGGLDDEETQMSYERACSFALSQHELSNLAIPYEFDVVDKDEDELLLRYKTFVAVAHQIAARDFEIDEFHEIALCPGADLFNHGVRNTVRFESLFNVCGQCGDSACDHMMVEEEEEEEDDEHCGEVDSDLELSEEGEQSEEDEHEDEHEEEQEEEQEEEPEFEGTIEEFIEVIESSIEQERRLMDEPEEEQPSPLILDDTKPIEAEACCDIVLHHASQKGDELFNTYGDFSNSQLLAKYGFVIPDNPNDTVGLGLQFLKLKKKKQYNRAFEWWDSEGYDLLREYLHSSKHGHEHDDCESDCDDGCGDGCEDGCCGEEDHDDVPSWTMEMRLQHSGEPSQLTYALTRLLSLNSAELQKFLVKKAKINPQVLTMSSKKAYKILLELVDERRQLYNDDYARFRKSKNSYERMASQLVSDELAIIERANKYINKRV